MLHPLRPDGFIEPCQPVGAAKPPSGPSWLHEIKHDGYRNDGVAPRRRRPIAYTQRQRLDRTLSFCGGEHRGLAPRSGFSLPTRSDILVAVPPVANVSRGPTGLHKG